jgi:thioesterase domain-containing protein
VSEDAELLVPLQAPGSRRPLFCIHPVSGSAYAYSGLVQLLDADQPVYGFEAPGFDNDRVPVDSMTRLSEQYCDILLEFQPTGDFQLLGWSFGGALAFDMAVRLTAAGAHVARLVIVDATLPWVAELPPEKAVVSRFLGDLAGISGVPQEDFVRAIADAADSASPAELFTRVERAELLPEEIDAEMLLTRYVTFRAHLHALYTYEVTTVYDGEAMHVRAAESPREYMRWDKVSPKLTELVLPGDHYSIWTGDSLTELGRAVNDYLLP